MTAPGAEVRHVESCNGCPFSSDGSYDNSSQWMCHAKWTGKGWPMEIPTPTTRTPIPKRCPLRTTVILIALQPPKTRTR